MPRRPVRPVRRLVSRLLGRGRRERGGEAGRASGLALGCLGALSLVAVVLVAVGLYVAVALDGDPLWPLVALVSVLAFFGVDVGHPTPAPAPYPNTPTAALAPVCAPVMLYELRGSGQDPGQRSPQVAGYSDEIGIAVRRALGVTAALAGAPMEADYPAVATTAGDAALLASIHRGVQVARADLTDLRTRCPGSAVFVVGFSQGAAVAHLLAGAGGVLADGFVLLGDPLHPPERLSEHLPVHSPEVPDRGGRASFPGSAPALGEGRLRAVLAAAAPDPEVGLGAGDLAELRELDQRATRVLSKGAVALDWCIAEDPVCNATALTEGQREGEEGRRVHATGYTRTGGAVRAIAATGRWAATAAGRR